MPILGIIASGISGHLTPAYDPSAYDALATVNVTSATASIIFSGIPTGYKDIQFRMLTRNSRSATGMSATMVMQFNADTASNYTSHYFYSYQGSGGGVTQGASTSVMWIGDNISANATANTFAGAIVDVLDYASSIKYKTIRSLMAGNTNGDGEAGMFGGNWRNYNPITSITFTHSGGYNFEVGSTIAMYGVK